MAKTSVDIMHHSLFI